MYTRPSCRNVLLLVIIYLALCNGEQSDSLDEVWEDWSDIGIGTQADERNARAVGVLEQAMNILLRGASFWQKDPYLGAKVYLKRGGSKRAFKDFENLRSQNILLQTVAGDKGMVGDRVLTLTQYDFRLSTITISDKLGSEFPTKMKTMIMYTTN